jgi:hypothetical protein
MLLRSITKHVKDQNWFAVAIDFFIVVIGVYIGLQVQEWSINKDKEKRETIYLNRLHAEVLQTVEFRKGNVTLRFRVVNSLNTAYSKLMNKTEQINLTKNECSAIANAHIISDITADLPTLTELLSAGQLDTISSIDITSNLIQLIQTRDRGGDALVFINSTLSPLYQLYPELIKLNGYEEGVYSEDDVYNPDCDSTQMRNNQAFINHFIDLRTRFGWYVRIIRNESESITKLHLDLDKALGIAHSAQ